jgi:cytosine deaminase
MAAGLTVAFGQDCVMDPWYPLGAADMLDAASMGLHVAMMTGSDAMRACFMAVTENPARILGLEGYGIEPGCFADLVILQAADPVEAIRLRATRLNVIRRGTVIAETAPAAATLHLPGRPVSVDYALQPR